MLSANKSQTFHFAMSKLLAFKGPNENKMNSRERERVSL
jgi:hypothetical protein